MTKTVKGKVVKIGKRTVRTKKEALYGLWSWNGNEWKFHDHYDHDELASVRKDAKECEGPTCIQRLEFPAM